MLAAILACLACGARAEDGTMIGKPLAGLNFDHVVSRAPFRVSDVSHRVTLVTFFRDGDTPCDDALAAVEKVASRYSGDERFRACHVLTALEQDATDPPELDDLVREKARSRNSTVTIMRDRGNQSLLACSAGKPPVLPLSVLCGEDGIVRWTGVLGTPEKAKEFQKALEAAYLDFDAKNLEPRTKGMKECERAWNSREFAKCWRELSKVLEKPEFTDTDREQGRLLYDGFTTVADHEVAIAQDKRSRGYPKEALKMLERGAKVLKEVPAVEKLDTLIKDWRKEKDYLLETAEQSDLEQILEKLNPAGCPREQVKENLRAFSQKRAESPVCRRAGELADLVK